MFKQAMAATIVGGRNENRSARAISRNATLGLLTFFSGSLTGLIATPLLFSHMGQRAFGLWVFLLGLVGYVGIIELGVGTATWRGIAAAQARGDDAGIAVVLG